MQTAHRLLEYSQTSAPKAASGLSLIRLTWLESLELFPGQPLVRPLKPSLLQDPADRFRGATHVAAVQRRDHGQSGNARFSLEVHRALVRKEPVKEQCTCALRLRTSVAGSYKSS